MRERRRQNGAICSKPVTKGTVIPAVWYLLFPIGGPYPPSRPQPRHPQPSIRALHQGISLPPTGHVIHSNISQVLSRWIITTQVLISADHVNGTSISSILSHLFISGGYKSCSQALPGYSTCTQTNNPLICVLS